MASLNDEIVKAVTAAQGQLTGVAKEAMAKAVATVAETLSKIVTEGLEPIKTELQTKADALATTATGGLEKLTAAIVTIPGKVKELLATLCGVLPNDDLKTLCNTKGAEVIESATAMLGTMCSSGVKSLSELAKTGCAKASTATEGLITQAAGKCTAAMQSLPTEAQESLTKTCTTVTTSFTGVVGQLCENTTTTLNTGLEASCQKIGASAAAKRRLLSHMTDMLQSSELLSRAKMGVDARQALQFVSNAKMQSLELTSLDPDAAMATLKTSLTKAWTCMCVRAHMCMFMHAYAAYLHACTGVRACACMHTFARTHACLCIYAAVVCAHAQVMDDGKAAFTEAFTKARTGQHNLGYHEMGSLYDSCLFCAGKCCSSRSSEKGSGYNHHSAQG